MRSENDKCRYLFVDAKDVVNYPNKTLNDYFHKYDRPFINLEEIFDYYDIPDKYRFLVVKINPLFSKYECQEYFTKIPFDYTGYTRFKNGDNNKLIIGRSVYDNKSNTIQFQTFMDFKSYDDVVNFAFGIIDDELLSKYKMAVLSIFNISFDYNNVYVLNKYRKIRK